MSNSLECRNGGLCGRLNQSILRYGSALCVLLVIGATGSSPAASVSWGASAFIAADTDVVTDGHLVYAYTFGDTGVPAATVNGVSFSPFAAAMSSSGIIAVGDVSLDLNYPENSYKSTNTQTGSNSTPFASLSSAYKNLLQSAVGTEGLGGELILTLGGLNIGQTYTVQIWSSDSGGFTNLDGVTYINSGASVELDNTSGDTLGGVGKWVLGTFIADASTQAFGFLTPYPDTPVLNALQLRTAIPEPSTWALLLLGGIGLGLRSRRLIALPGKCAGTGCADS